MSVRDERKARFALLLTVSLVGACAEAAIDKDPLGSLAQDPSAVDRQDAGGDESSDNGGDTDTGSQVDDPQSPANGGGPLDGEPGSNDELDAGLSGEPDAGDDEGEADAGTAEGECALGQTACGTTCVDLDTSADHCGSCDHACPGDAQCDGSGRCKAPKGCTSATFGGHDYFFCTGAATWSVARSACQDAGTDLAVITSATENEFARTGGGGWIGVNDITRENTFRLLTPGTSGNGNTAPVFAPFATGQPSNDCGSIVDPFCVFDPGEDCVELKADGKWNDARCTLTKKYVCESF